MRVEATSTLRLRCKYRRQLHWKMLQSCWIRKLDQSRLYQFLEIFVRHLDQLGMRTSIERNLFILGKNIGNVNIQTVKIAERRHCTNIAIGKLVLKFHFVCKPDIFCAQSFMQLIEINFVGSGQNKHCHLAVNFDEHGLSHFGSFDVSRSGNLLRCKRQ